MSTDQVVMIAEQLQLGEDIKYQVIDTDGHIYNSIKISYAYT